MNLIKSVTFSKKVSLALYGLSFLILGYALASAASLSEVNMWIFAFAVGSLVAYPIINYSWRDVKENWDSGASMNELDYRELFVGDLGKNERTKLVKKHWKNVWWIVPYVFTAYFYISYMVAYMFSAYALLPFFGGSLFSIGFTTYEYQKTFDV